MITLDPNLSLAELVEMSCRESFLAGLHYGRGGEHSPERQERLRAIDAAVVTAIRAAAPSAALAASHARLLEALKLVALVFHFDDFEPGETQCVDKARAAIAAAEGVMK